MQQSPPRLVAITPDQSGVYYMDALLCSQADARAMLAIGKTKLVELISQNKLETVRIGTRRLVRVDSVRRLAGVEPDQRSAA